MTYFIVGAILAVLVIAGTFGLCVYLIKRADYIKKNSWQIIAIICGLIFIGLLAAFFVIFGGSQLS